MVATAILCGLLYNAIAVDRIPPTYSLKVSSTTASGEAQTLASVEVEFSEDVRHDTAEKAFSIDPDVTGTFHWNGRTLIFTPSAKLPLSTTFKVREDAGVEDDAGNRQGSAVDMTFTTVGSPTVVSVTPATNQQAVDVSTSIQITFDREMDTEQVVKGLRIDPLLGYSVTWNGPALTIQPDRPLAYGTTYTITIGDPAVDTDGTPLDAYVTTFKTVAVGLQVASLIPAPNVAGVSPRSPIAVVFDAPIDPDSISGSIMLTPPVAGSVQVVSLPDDRNPPAAPTPTTATSGANVLVFTPDNPLAAHTTYSVSLASTVKRTDGQVAPAETWSFTTGEAPTSALNQIAFLSDRGGVSNVWLMNPDGSNQRELTTELVPVSGYDISGDGTTIAYSAGGVVKKMGIGGDGLQTLTPSGDLEYAPTFTPDGLGLIVGRRDGTGADLGYWRYPLATGTDLIQLTPDGAPGIGSVSLKDDGLTGEIGAPSWASRAAFNADGSLMLLVRGSDGVVELVDTTAVAAPIQLSMIANSRPVFDAVDGSFYVIGSEDNGATWACWRVGGDGTATRLGAAASDLATTGGTSDSLAMIVASTDGSFHLAYAADPEAAPKLLTTEPTWWELSPSFSPDGSLVVFGRALASNPKASSGIWVVGVDGQNLANLATDGAYPRWIP